MTNARFAVTAASADQPPLVVVSGDIDLANVNWGNYNSWLYESV